ncbi:MAG: hypothetical protein MUF18_10280 [Fimbriiglobus sp.]|nr:hypothetical protein [Fimbriiglobus sp.]
MNRLLNRTFSIKRWVYLPAVAAVVTVGLNLCYPGGLSAAFADLRDAPHLTATVEGCQSTDRQLNGKLSLLRDRMGYKEELIASLLHGRADLMTVVNEFAALNRDDSVIRSVHEMHYGELCEREMAALNVLDYAELRLLGDGGSSVVLSRLRAAFELEFGHPPRKSQ